MKPKPYLSSFLFLLTHQAGAAPELKPLAASEAVERLVKGLDLGVFSPLERRNFTRSQAAAILGRTARCYELLSGDLGKTVRLIESLVAEP